MITGITIAASDTKAVDTVPMAGTVTTTAAGDIMAGMGTTDPQVQTGECRSGSGIPITIRRIPRFTLRPSTALMNRAQLTIAPRMTAGNHIILSAATATALRPTPMPALAIPAGTTAARAGITAAITQATARRNPTIPSDSITAADPTPF